jgi:flagellar assembly protein FliH
MSSSSRPAGAWAPSLDLTPAGLSQFDPRRVQRAIDDGYRDGLEAGRAEALAVGQAAVTAELDTIRHRASALLDGLARAGDALASQEEATARAFAATVAQAAVEVARAAVGRELADEVVAATAAVERSLTALGRRPGTVVQLHPDDIALLGGETLPEGLRLEPNPGLDRGDALAHTDDRTVDARIATALDRALAALTGADDGGSAR